MICITNTNQIIMHTIYSSFIICQSLTYNRSIFNFICFINPTECVVSTINIQTTCCYCTAEHNVFEIIRTVVLPFIYHTIDNTFTFDGICPSIFCAIVIQTVPYFPSSKITIGEISITFMLYGITFFL